jgi:hypothetical protein
MRSDPHVLFCDHEHSVQEDRHPGNLDPRSVCPQTARFLCRDEDEVRQKARQLGPVEHQGKRRKIRVVR